MMISQNTIIRKVNLRDVDKLHEMGIIEENFAVSSRTRFYDRDYLRNWIMNPNGDILLVAEIENEIIGFLFCRLVRDAWAILENIAVSHSKRMLGIGTLLLEECLRQLRAKGINYIAGIVKEGNESTDFFISNGFSFGNRFVWIERYLAKEKDRE